MNIPPRAVVTLAARVVGGLDSTFIGEDIPPAKLCRARRVHAEHLESHEEVLVLHDSTVFGSAEDGLVITPRRLCWKNLAEEPVSCTWDRVDPTSVVADGRDLLVAGGAIHMSLGGAATERFASLVRQLAEAARDAGRFGEAPYRTVATADLRPLTFDELVETATRHLAGRPNFYVAPSIPSALAQTAYRTHRANLPPDEPIVAVYDDTVFGQGDEGFVVTADRVCWRNALDEPRSVRWTEVAPDAVHADGFVLSVAGGTMAFGLCPVTDIRSVELFFLAVARLRIRA